MLLSSNDAKTLYVNFSGKSATYIKPVREASLLDDDLGYELNHVEESYQHTQSCRTVPSASD